MSQYIKITEVAARAKMQLRLSDAEADARLQAWIEEGARQLNCLSAFVENTDILDIVDNKVKLPCGFWKLLGASPMDDSCCYLGTLTYIDTVFANNCCTTLCTSILFPNCCNYESWFKIIGNYLHFNAPCDATKVELCWMGLNTDEEGMMLIEERYERGLANYAMAMEGYSPGSNISQTLADTYFSIWDAQKSMLRGQDNKKMWDTQKRWIGINYLNRVQISYKI